MVVKLNQPVKRLRVLSCLSNAQPNTQMERCEILDGGLRMKLNMAFHTLSWAVALYYLHVAKTTRARTAQVQLGFLQCPAMLHVCKHHQS